MAKFKYTGRNRKGEEISAEIEAKDKEEALAKLRQQRIQITSIKKKATEFNLSFGSGGVKTKQIAVLTRQFSTMVNAGLPIVACMDILSKQGENMTLRATMKKVKESVEGGKTLAESMAKHKKIFDDLYVNMVKAGEKGGILDVILGRLATYIEKMDKIKRKVKGAMVYPAIVLTVAALAIVVMLVFVIPTFSDMFAEMGAALPLPTRIVITASNQLKKPIVWLLLVGSVVGIFFFIKWLNSFPKGRYMYDKFKLRLPLLGNLILKSSISRFTNTLGTLLGSGINIVEALDISAKTSGNEVIAKEVRNIKESIQQGKTMVDPLKKSKVFPDMVVQMIAVGEETGALDDMLNRIAAFYDEEVNEAVETLLSAIEPIMIVMLGTIVGGMLIAMYMPMFTMINAID